MLHSEVDAFGHDIVFECQGVIRHIQLKAMVRGGKRRDVGVSISLARRPSGCVIWMLYDPLTLELGPFLWFGGARRAAAATWTKGRSSHQGHSEGVKAQRSSVRLISRSQFVRLDTIEQLADRLFGIVQGSGPAAREAQIELLREHLHARPAAEIPEHREPVRAGDFTAIPEDLAWKTSVELAHLIDGYELVKQAGWGDAFRFAEVRLGIATTTGEWLGGPAELWASLFLEHRRWRMAGIDPDPQQLELLDRLCAQLRASLA